MTGLTSNQAWTLERITRCTCGSWMVLTEEQRWQLAELDIRPTCPHINPAAMEATA